MSEIKIGSRVRLNENYGTSEFRGHQLWGAKGTVEEFDGFYVTVVMDNPALHVLDGCCLFNPRELDIL
jgi:hypothetical protein